MMKFEITRKLETRKIDYETNYRVALIEIETVETDEYTKVYEHTRLHYLVEKKTGKVFRQYGSIEHMFIPYKYIGTK